MNGSKFILTPSAETYGLIVQVAKRRKKSGFQVIRDFFNSKKSNKVFTRAEYFAALKRAKLKASYMDTLRLYLTNAGYLVDEEPGVYRKLKKIPENLTYTQLYREAYPK